MGNEAVVTAELPDGNEAGISEATELSVGNEALDNEAVKAYTVDEGADSEFPIESKAPTVVKTPAVTETISGLIPKAMHENGAKHIQQIVPVVSDIWLFGVCAIFLYSLISYALLVRKLRTAVGTDEAGVYVADGIRTAFVLGLFRERIYLPSGLPDNVAAYVLEHERMHIRRRDHLLKFVAYVVTVVHYANPFVWIMYIMLTRDIELACDESVICDRSADYRQEYAKALLSMAVDVRGTMLSPLAFSEGSPKKRIKVIAGYRKPAAAVTMLGLAACLMLGCGLLTSKPEPPNDSASVSNADAAADDKSRSQYERENAESERERQADIEQYEKERTESEKERQAEEDVRGKPEAIKEESERTEKRGESEKAAKASEGADVVSHTGESGTNTAGEAGGEIVKVTRPVVELSATYGADAPKLLYADHDMIVFAGYFGMFVYSKKDDRIIRAVDLAVIGCDATQGDSACELQMLEDGDSVYMIPAADSCYYVYSIEKNILTRYNGKPKESPSGGYNGVRFHLPYPNPNGYDEDEWVEKGVKMKTWLGCSCTAQNGGTIGGLVWLDMESYPKDSPKFDPLACANYRYLFPPEGYENTKRLSMADIREAGVAKLEMRVNGRLVQISDAETLEMFERAYNNAEESSGWGCPFYDPMYITLNDGTVGYVNPGTDSCGALLTADGYYHPLEGDMRDKLVNKLDAVFGWQFYH